MKGSSQLLNYYSVGLYLALNLVVGGYSTDYSFAAKHYEAQVVAIWCAVVWTYG